MGPICTVTEFENYGLCRLAVVCSYNSPPTYTLIVISLRNIQFLHIMLPKYIISTAECSLNS